MTASSQRVVDLVASVTQQPAESVTPEARLAQDLLVKSANRIELSVLLEDAFGVTISVFEILGAQTVGDVITLVEAKSAAAT